MWTELFYVIVNCVSMIFNQFLLYNSFVHRRSPSVRRRVITGLCDWLTCLMPMDVEWPGLMVMPSSSGKGIRSCAWTTSRIPAMSPLSSVYSSWLIFNIISSPGAMKVTHWVKYEYDELRTIIITSDSCWSCIWYRSPSWRNRIMVSRLMLFSIEE